jgi:hypothetical protein
MPPLPVISFVVSNLPVVDKARVEDFTFTRPKFIIKGSLNLRPKRTTEKQKKQGTTYMIMAKLELLMTRRSETLSRSPY